jgi:hyperosmotically inducible protein
MRKTLIVGMVLAGLAGAPLVLAQDADTDRAHPKAFVKDSVITTKVKSKLAAQHMGSLAHVRVDTDENGVVWLSGTAHSQEAADKAVELARDTEGVKDVHSHIKVRADQ